MSTIEQNNTKLLTAHDISYFDGDATVILNPGANKKIKLLQVVASVLDVDNISGVATVDFKDSSHEFSLPFMSVAIDENRVINMSFGDQGYLFGVGGNFVVTVANSLNGSVSVSCQYTIEG